MQLAAPYMAEKIIAAIQDGYRFDAILTSSFIDVAVLQTLLRQAGISLPLGVYFHENQLAYPLRPEDTDRHQFAAINCTSALCADAVAFNSTYNLETFLLGIKRFTQKYADFPLPDIAEKIRKKATVLYPGMDYTSIPPIDRPECTNKLVPVIVWNHRWEHDKNPDEFFSALFELQKRGYAFELIVLGESFRNQPEIFAHAQTKLASHIRHFGYCPNKEDYYTLLTQGTIIVSTALHEFFGISVLEGVRAGCWPLVPDRLSYQEIFPRHYRYTEGQVTKALAALMDQQQQLTQTEALTLTEAYSWASMKDAYEVWLAQLRKTDLS